MRTSVAADAARVGGPAQASYSRQVRECLAVIAGLIDNPDHQAAEREAVLTLSVLVGAISIARAVDAPDLSKQIMTQAAAALKQRNHVFAELGSAACTCGRDTHGS